MLNAHPMSTHQKLNDKLLSQCFTADKSVGNWLEPYRQVAAGYANVENAVAVLSDLKMKMSYIYYGGVAALLGIGEKGASEVISSIWEKEVFKTIEPSDLEKRNLDELQFFHFMKEIPQTERGDYYLVSCINMRTSKELIPVYHRIFYLTSPDEECIRLALCLYNVAPAYIAESYICHTLNGSRTLIDRRDSTHILSEREKEILRLIEQGKLSKEIAPLLSISIHTVNRHRQNILEKLRAQNSFEACQTARSLNLL